MKAPQITHLLLASLAFILLCFSSCDAFGPQVVSREQRLTPFSLFSSRDEEVAMPEPPAPVKCPNCDLCDGSGRIAGGLGAVLPWLPIKAYRPCPNFIDRGGDYQRSGQGLDEIAFGRDSTFRSDS